MNDSDVAQSLIASSWSFVNVGKNHVFNLIRDVSSPFYKNKYLQKWPVSQIVMII